MNRAPIFILSGTPAAGKTTVAKALAQEFSLAVQVSVDDIRGWVLSGFADHLHGWNQEGARQFRLARQTAAAAAKLYAKASFAVMIDDLIFPQEVVELFDPLLATCEVYKILLRPSVEVALARNEQRELDSAELLDAISDIIEPVYDRFNVREMTKTGWHIIDSSRLTVEETVEVILDRTGY